MPSSLGLGCTVKKGQFFSVSLYLAGKIAATMTRNISDLERIIRIILALFLTLLFVTGKVQGTWGILALTGAVLLALTAYYWHCPLYTIPNCFRKKRSA
jgi:hypothetical protein